MTNQNRIWRISFSKLFSLLLLVASLTACQSSTSSFEQEVRVSVKRQLETFPKSTLKDLYKNFFQDEFGPGHLIADTAAARNYLRKELAGMEGYSGPITETLGRKGDYLRVNLGLLKQGAIAEDLFFDLFVRSVNGVTPPSIDQWKRDWQRIERIIRTMHLELPDYETDKQSIEEQLNQNEYVGHHSKQYEEAYQPHYRIVSRELFEKELMPYLESFRKNRKE